VKRISVVLIILLSIAGYNYAQEPERGSGERPSKEAGKGDHGGRPQMTPEEMLKRQNQRMVQELKLTKDQEAKVSAINKRFMDKNIGSRDKMRDATDEERKAFREQMRKMNDEKNKEIKALLTADQLILFDEMQKKNAEAMKKRQGDHGGPPSGGQGQ